MPSEVRHQVDGGQTYPVVRVAGVLDDDDARDLGSTLLDLLAGQPEALIVDVGDLTAGRSAAVAVLAGIGRSAAAWPGCTVVLVTGPDRERTAAWRETGLTTWPAATDAFAALGPPEPDRFLQASLEPVLGAARLSRELVTEICARWDLPDLAGPACIVITEMVNNVVAHVHSPMTVLLGIRGDSMSVAVRDDSPHVPEFTGSPVPVTSYGGRGLLLIDSVARRWGSLVLGHGKVVWAVLDTGDHADKQLPGAGMAGRVRG